MPGPVIGACLGALAVLALTCTGAWAGTRYIDGISDQSLPEWDGSFAGSPFANFFRSRWAREAAGQISLARYVLQWDAIAEGSTGAHAGGDYRERFEAWLVDVRSLGLTPVVALTSYDHVYPRSPVEYRAGLEAILNRASAIGYPINYVEPWNEPNGQGSEDSVSAAAFANNANDVCGRFASCTVVAGDFEDRSSALAYAQEYEQALSFSPGIWGVHPYVSVQSHSNKNLLRLISALRAGGADRQIWFTEIGALYCARGRVRGEARQASDASYLVNTLLRDPALAPTHVFYYGFLFGDRASAPCRASGGEDSELYGSSGAPRAAAEVLLRPVGAGEQSAREAQEWPRWNRAASLMLDAPPVSRGER
ncbi:MAG TPA: hypothetical protein VGW98_06720 [Solirubrobacteraceae bacterium]|nr:hypothetical protein [Solirubrobacteraceae bacterium]